MDKPGPIIQIFATPVWGGGEQFVYDLSRRLIGDGCRVVFVSRRSRAIRERVETLDVPCHVLPMKGAVDGVSALMLARLLLRYRPSVIHVHQFKDAFTAVYARLLCRFFGVAPRIVLTRHLVRKGKRGRLYRWLYDRLDRMVFVSEFARQAFLSSGPCVDAAKTMVIRNSSPDRRPEGASPQRDLRAEYGLASGVPLLLFSGRVVPEKGCDVLLRACARLGERPFALFFAGATDDAAYGESLHRLIAENGLDGRVFFLGFVRGMAGLLDQADVCVSPSVCCEAGSLTVIEAMQAGCAVVASDNGSQPEYVDDGVTGLLVPPGDDEALARALAGLLDDPGLRNRMGAAARRKFAEQLCYERFYTTYYSLYNE